MRELYLKRNESNRLLKDIKPIKYKYNLPDGEFNRLLDTQRDINNRRKFYNSYLKKAGEIRSEKICFKEK